MTAISMDAKLFEDLLPELEDFLLDIHTAASIGCDERVRDIIESSENRSILDERNKKGWTPLMYAACCANLKVVLLLLEENAHTDIKNYEGHTALILASKCGSGDVVNVLIDHGASVNDRDLKGWTALFYASAFGHRSVVQLLIEKGAIVNTVDDNGRITPLMLAAAAGHERIVHDLLQLGLNINVESKYGDTARSLAVKNGHVNVKNMIDTYLLSKKRNNGPNIRSSDLACLLKDLQLAKYYPLFESHDIDLNTFWCLTDDDLKEIGIQLLGPRKKICVAISQYHQEHFQKNTSKETINVESILLENKKLHHANEKLKAMVLHEKNSKLAMDRSLADCIQNIKNYSEILKSTIGQAIDFLENLKESQDYLKTLLCNTFQDINFNSNTRFKSKVDSIFQSLDCMQTLVEIQHQNMRAVQQKANNNFS